MVLAAACDPPPPSLRKSSKTTKAKPVAKPKVTTPPPLTPAMGPVRPMVFPVNGNVTYSDTFGAPRSGGRTHEGQDLMGAKGTVLVAAVDGTVTLVRHSNDGLSGNMLRITDVEGWQYVYLHINNDHPGTDDAANVFEQAFADGMRVGQSVRAGEPVAFLGDSGNAEDAGSHLHFELHTPDGAAVNAYASLRSATHTALTPAEVAGNAPVGSLDLVATPGGGIVHVAGWALDRVVDVPVPVSVYVDGNYVVTAAAGSTRNDIATAYPGRGADHGFDTTIVAGVGAHQVCVILHNAGLGGGSSRVGCAAVAVS